MKGGRLSALVEEPVADLRDLAKDAHVRAVGSKDVTGMDNGDPGLATCSREPVDRTDDGQTLWSALDEAALQIDVDERIAAIARRFAAVNGSVRRIVA
jgi:hypothetical protein